MSADFDNNRENGRPSENGKASFSVVRGGASRPHAGAQSRNTYEADAQALADIWDPKKSKEREEAAAAEAAAAAAEAAKREEERVARQQAAREQAARKKAAREQEAQKTAAQSGEAANNSEFLDTLAESRKRLASLPEIGEPKRLVDLRAAIPVIADPNEEKAEPVEGEPATASAEGESEGEQASPEGEAVDEYGQEIDPEATADLPVIGVVDEEGDEEAEGESDDAQPSDRTKGKPVRRKSTQKGGTAVRKPVSKKSGSTWKIVLGVILALVVIVGGAAGYASLMRWVLVDDEADIQGSWHLSGEPVSVTITGDQIDLAEKVAYSYTIDTQAKVITETLGNMEGASRYRFSEDRNSIALFDDSSTDWWGNAMKDLQWFIVSFFAKTFNGQEPDLLGGESGVVMYRAGFDAPGVVTSATNPAGEEKASAEATGEPAPEGEGQPASPDGEPAPEAEVKAEAAPSGA